MVNNLEQTTCKRCGRKLKNPNAIELGMGATCWKKFMAEDNHKPLFTIESKQKLDEALENLPENKHNDDKLDGMIFGLTALK